MRHTGDVVIGSGRIAQGRVALLAVLSLALPACGGEAGDTSAQTNKTTASTGSASGPTSGIGPGLTISQARTTDVAGPLLVRGALLIDDGSARLCERLAESAPPQCGGDSLDVEGLDPSTVEALQSMSGVQWADEVKLLGEVEGDRLVVSPGSTG